MNKEQHVYHYEDIEFRIVYSQRRTMGISVLSDSSVIVRAPYRASLKTISRVVREKADWIIKHRDNYKQREHRRLNGIIANGQKHLLRGIELPLLISASARPFVRFSDNSIEVGLPDKNETETIRRLLNSGYRAEAARIFPEYMSRIMEIHKKQMFRPTGLSIRTMKSRWGSCSSKGRITLSTELIKLPDRFLEYVIIHELCHLKHHNHGKDYYLLLSELLPDWEKTRKDIRVYIH
jgi:predicted metal-dependent hydrolase